MRLEKVVILSLVLLVKTVFCAAVIPGINDILPGYEAPNTPNSDISDVTDSFSPVVEPTVPAGESETAAPVNKLVSDSGVRQTVTSTKAETPGEISNWLQALRDLELRSKMTVIQNRVGSSEMTPTDSSVLREEIELPSPDQLFKWLDSIPPLQKGALNSGDKMSTENDDAAIEKGVSRHDTSHKIDIEIKGSKLILMIGVPAVVLLLCLVVITIYIVYKKKLSAKKKLESKLTGFGSINRNLTVFSVGDKDNVFMGIPANNQIWKEIQMLPSTASSVMPESSSM